ncbi:4-amino-4-deoxy-L-arabinose transferase-like glycosyltransferase [Fulvimonas soli]|uniref:4-amino-4-deoxy-L-arabinose transferase-like glycosyltransferase n=2 Tax=Fulvimonas soli TaxID=155197 RepID=A0A316IH56_9GAMM|nr:4-amino-4-deoxy-L-arabinose transferase-like glycosyltransferase [Fulvimonas soli]
MSAYTRSEHLRALWPWLPLWSAAALLAIFSHGPMPLFSTRTLAVAWEMWSQHHWLVPYINGEPYSEKVPLLFWMIHAGWFAFGVNDVWPRVLEVAFGAIQLVLAATLARRLFPDRPWIAKATPWLLMALSYAFLFGLQIMYEVLLAAWVLGALLCLTPSPRRAEPRWLLFGLLLGAGLLTKGPVMLLHVAFPWLLGPLWSEWAREHRARWYGRGLLAVLLGLAILLAWALPAGFSGGEAYRHRLFFTQTAGRVVDGVAPPDTLQNHAQPFWWYLLCLPVLMFPLSAWPRATAALAMLRRPLEPGLRFLLCWLLPNFVAFSLVSGKQAYYPLPEFGGGVMLIAAAVALLRERHPRLGANGWLGTWPLGVGGLLLAALLFALPDLVASGRLHGEWLDAASLYSRSFSVVFLLLGLLLLLRGRGEMRRLAFAGLAGTLAMNTLFTLTLWPNYDLRPATDLLRAADGSGRAIGIVGGYDGQFHFAGRLTRPLARLQYDASLQAFAQAHPDGLVVTHLNHPGADAMRYALLVQPFRSSWLVVWPAATLASLQAGHAPPEPAQPPRFYPRAGGLRASP